MVAGGGTGGHFYCGLAFAQKYLSKYPQAEVIFIGVRKGIEGRHRFSDPRMKLEFVQALGFAGNSPLQKVLALLSLGFGFLGSLMRVIRHRPRFVLGVGGYASASTMLAAAVLRPFLKHKVAVVDQNSVPGSVNRFLARLVPAYAPFPYAGFKTIELPLRDEVEAYKANAKEVEWPPKTLFIMGGSQGAMGINKAWIRLLSDLRASGREFQIFHQTGTHSFQNVQAAYNEFRMEAEVFAFSAELSQYLSQADLVIARAGALSIFECIFFERPSVFVPYPHAADNHQFKNAQAVQAPAWIVPEARLDWRTLESLMKQPPKVPTLRQKPVASWRSLFQA